MKKKEALVIHSGGMDSSICLALAMKEFGKDNVLSLSFSYNQRHTSELQQAAQICKEWGIEHVILKLDCLQEITENALTNHSLRIEHKAGLPPNTLVVGRNGLMARLGAIHANHLGASCIYMGIIELDGGNSGYRDCSRRYMDLMEQILQIDLNDGNFKIKTPLVKMTKLETNELAFQLGILDFLLKNTISCYEGVPQQGCLTCPACVLRNEGLRLFSCKHPGIRLPYNAPAF